MTIKECIDTVYAVKPHEYTVVDQVRWLSFVEKIIIDEVLKTHEGYDGRYDEFIEYSPDNTSVELIVPAPHDRLYAAFLTMKIDELNNEIERFNNSRLLYNSYMLEYRKYYNKTHMPLSVTGVNKSSCPVKPQVILSEAEFENLKRSLYYQLSEDFSTMISQDRLNEIISSYLMNNVAVFKGKDGKDGIDGHGWIVSGFVSDEEKLPNLGTEWQGIYIGLGVVFGVGTQEPYKYYMMTQTENELGWKYQGTFSPVMAESYARGNTGVRGGENTDNAKYYSDKAKEYAGNATAEKTKAEGFVHQAEGFANDAKAHSQTALRHSSEAERAKLSAQQTVEEAQSLRDDVQIYPPIAERHARTAESWARGGTGIREGEDTDNAKYYSEQIGNHANDAKNYAQKAEQHANDAEAAVDLARQHSNASGSYAKASEQSANEAKDEANNAYVAKSAAERIAEEAQQYAGEAQQHAEEAQLRANDSGAASTAASEYAEESRNSANEAKDYAEQAQNAVVGIYTPYANALKGSASGEMVSMKDVSPIEHKIDVELSSKNLIPYPYANTTRTQNGITFTDNGDGSITVNGTATDNAFFDIAPVWGEYNLPAGSYFLSGCPANGDASTYRIALALKNEYTSSVYLYDGSDRGLGARVNISKDATLIYCRIVIIKGFTANNLVFKPQLEIGTVATPNTPYVADVSEAKLYKTGKNLLDIDSMLNDVLTKNGDTYTMTRTDNENLWRGRISLYFPIFIPAGTPLVFSVGSITYNGTLNMALGVQVTLEGGSRVNDLSLGKTVTVKTAAFDKNITELVLYINLEESVGTPITTFTKPMLEVGTVASEHESYIEPIEVDKDNVTSLYPTTTLYSDTSGVLIEAEYNRDLNKVIAELYSAIANL